MSIAELKRVSICGLVKDKDALLDGLQELGCMHLLPLRPPPEEIEKRASPKAEQAYKALRFLSDIPNRRKQVTRDSSFDIEAVVEQAMELKQKIRDVGDRRDFLAHRINQVEPWGDINFPPEVALAGYRLWFYVIPAKKLGELEAIDLPWQIVNRTHTLVYVVVISKSEPPSDLFSEPRTHTGSLPLRELRAQLEDAEVELEELDSQARALTRHIYLMSVNLAEAENRAARNFAEQQAMEDNDILAVQGWVPVDAMEAVETLADDRGLACLIEDAAAEDEPPTLLEQSEQMEAAVDLAMFFQVPNYRNWDPSILIFGSFAIFFAMILSDAGYAALLLGGLYLYSGKLTQTARGRSYRVFLGTVFGCALIYGILVGSYFGVEPAGDTLLGKLHLIDINDFDSMMKASITIGILHIAFANWMIFKARSNTTKRYIHLGWIAGLFGGGLIWMGAETGWATFGYLLLIGGLLVILLFSSDRQVKEPMDFVWRAFSGLQGVMGVLGAFGDVLSYMRLFALGLASASLATTFNELAVSVAQSIPGLGLLLAILIVIFGHAINFCLGIVSGVVHGLRLNYIEFFKWGLPEEGKAFQRFAKKEVVS